MNDLYDGVGKIIYYKDEPEFYEGEWLRGEKYGEGNYIYGDERMYVG